MAQHFLLSPAAKTLSLAKVLRMTDEQAAQAFCAIRWHETGGKPVCPECEGMDHYDLKSRPVWKCKGCSKQFSMTSGTVFHSRKLKLRDILGAIAIFTNGAKGYSALQLSRDLGCDYKTSFVLLHKVRKSIQLARNEGALQGDVELDGAYFGGHVRPENRKEDRKDRRLAENQTGKRQVVVVARERNGRTLTTVAKSEAAGVAFAKKAIATGSTVHADEASHWDQLAANRGGPACSDRFSASISGTSAGVRPPSGLAASCVLRSKLGRVSCRQGSRAGGGDCRDRSTAQSRRGRPARCRRRAGRPPRILRWPRLFGQISRFDKWNVCRG